MKFPSAFRVFASINILFFLLFLIQSFILVYADGLSFHVPAVSVGITIWILTASFMWFFASSKSWTLLPLTAVSFLIFAGYSMYIWMTVLTPKDYQQFMPAFVGYAIICVIYSAFMFFAMSFKPVVEWKKNTGGKTDVMAIGIFGSLMVISLASFWLFSKVDAKYVNLESPEMRIESNGSATIDLQHLTEFDAINISKDDETQGFKAIVEYTITWNAAFLNDVVRTDTVIFKPREEGTLRRGETTPYIGSSNDIELFAKVPLIKARMIRITPLPSDEQTFTKSQYMFSFMHSVNHYGAVKKDQFLADDSKPVDNSASLPVETASLNEAFRTISDDEKNNLVKYSLEEILSDYEESSQYEFNIGNPRIVLNGKVFGMYRGFKSYLEGVVPRAAISVVRDNDPEQTEFSDPQDIATAISGVPLYRENKQLPFASINPDFIEWVDNKGLPEPDAQFYGQSVKQIYNAMFRKNIWILFAAHQYLNHDDFFQKEVDHYKAAMEKEGFQGVNWLWDTYGNADLTDSFFVIIDQKFPNNENETFYFSQDMAIGFWLRRKMDGSDEKLWSLVQNMIRKYDDDWPSFQNHWD
jgi:hypothetical protein